MYTIQGVISAYDYKNKRVSIKVYDGLNGDDVKTATDEWVSLTSDRAISFKAGDQIKAQISSDKKSLVSIGRLDSKKYDDFKKFFIDLNLKGASLKDRYKLFNAFGIDLLKTAKDRLPLLINNSRRYGYSMQSAVLIGSKAERIMALYKANQKLVSSGFDKSSIKHLMEKHGTALGNIIADNPYMLLAGGFSRFSDPFSNAEKERNQLLRVDSLVDNPSLPKWNSSRDYYALEMVIKRLESKGSTAFSKHEVTDELSKVLDLPFQESQETLDNTLSGKAYKTIDTGQDGYFITPAKNYKIEEMIADKLLERHNLKDVVIETRDLIFEDYYTDEQRQSIKLGIQKNLLVVTGGAGTGKTTVVKGILQNIKKVFGKHSEILLCAPTGKAAQRMSEATSLEARTIHSLLKFNPDKGFMEADIPQDTKVIVIDEASMVDSSLMYKILENVPLETKIIFVGDIQQVLPVKPGQPFKDMILSDLISSVRLTAPQRTGASSDIYLNANLIINGVMPDLLRDNMNDFHFIPTHSDSGTNREIMRILSEDIEGKFKSNMSRVQVISPKREPKGEVGMIGLNRSIQSLLNPDVVDGPNEKGVTPIMVGDKVVFNRNDYKLKLFNGDVGYVTSKNTSSGSLTINVDGRSVDIPKDKVRGLEHAFALSVHKTQGSEYDIVIMPLSKGHAHMLCPEVLYTAITRAKKHFVFVGDESVIKMALKNIHLNKRDTYLKARLVEAKMELGREVKEITSESPENSGKTNRIESPSNHLNDKKDAPSNNKIAIQKDEDEFDWGIGDI